MPSERVRPAFDESERERIRAALWTFKKQHKLGFEALANRIAEAIGYIPDDADSAVEDSFWKTLQRFMNQKHYTAHDTVGLYARFLSKVAPPDPGDQAGAALARFFAGPDARSTEELAPLAGRYVTLIRWSPPGPGEPQVKRPVGVRLAGHEESGDVWSLIELAVPTRGAFLRAKETILDTCHATQAKLMRRGTVQTGILAPCGKNEFMLLLRNYMENRLCLLRRESDGSLHGDRVSPDELCLATFHCAGKVAGCRIRPHGDSRAAIGEQKARRRTGRRVRNLTKARKSR